jgi:hypothetical protein
VGGVEEEEEEEEEAAASSCLRLRARSLRRALRTILRSRRAYCSAASPLG